MGDAYNEQEDDSCKTFSRVAVKDGWVDFCEKHQQLAYECDIAYSKARIESLRTALAESEEGRKHWEDLWKKASNSVIGLQAKLDLANKVVFWANEYRVSQVINCDSDSKKSAKQGLDKALADIEGKEK